jgi:hypothetical protein
VSSAAENNITVNKISGNDRETSPNSQAVHVHRRIAMPGAGHKAASA